MTAKLNKPLATLHKLTCASPRGIQCPHNLRTPPFAIFVSSNILFIFNCKLSRTSQLGGAWIHRVIPKWELSGSVYGRSVPPQLMFAWGLIAAANLNCVHVQDHPTSAPILPMRIGTVADMQISSLHLKDSSSRFSSSLYSGIKNDSGMHGSH